MTSHEWKQKKAGITVLMSDKTDFKTKMMKRQRQALHNEEGMNPPREYNTCINKYLCSQQQHLHA